MQDFAPVGTFEQVLVQQIAACIWRQRRLLMFENRAAFRSRDDRTYRELNQPLRGMAPLYVMEGEIAEAEEVVEEAGLGLDLPSERDTMRLMRYEGAVTRSLRNALAQLGRCSRPAAHRVARRPRLRRDIRIARWWWMRGRPSAIAGRKGFGCRPKSRATFMPTNWSIWRRSASSGKRRRRRGEAMASRTGKLPNEAKLS